MSRNRQLIIALAVCLVSTFAAFAQERGNQRGGGPNQTFTERYGQRLSLTDAQKTQIDDLEKAFQKDNADFIAAFQKTMSDYRAARQANDTAAMETLRPKAESQRAEMTKLRTALEEKFAATFTDAQKSEWTKIKEERAARMKEQSRQ